MMRVGTGIESLLLDDGHGLFGFGPNGGIGINVPPGSEEHDTLKVRALYMEHGAQRLLVIGLDLASGSRVVHQALLEGLAKRGHAFAPCELLVVGTHTHAAPGHVFGNLYDVFGQRPAGYREVVAAEIVRRGLFAAQQALAAPVECSFATVRRKLWGAGRNRSMRAFLANFEGELGRWHEALGLTPPAELAPEDQAVDPHLDVVAFVARDGGRPLATWATWCCHPASIPSASVRAYHRDWPGVAVDHLEQGRAGVPFAMMHQASNGDVTAIPSGALRITTPMARVRELGLRVGAAWADALEEACDRARAKPVAPPFEVGATVLDPERAGLPSFEIGQSVVAGSEEADPGLLVKMLGEARRFPWRASPHRPKLPALGPLQAVLRRHPSLRPSPEHPLWMLRLGQHVVFASPFEQTTFAAWTTAQSIANAWRLARGEVVTASPLALAGDYAGYLTTSAEYDQQEYEGGHTIYGRDQRQVVERTWLSMVDGRPLDATKARFVRADATFDARVRRIVDVLT
ncbi:MAG: neutral/alkaline non-lysosomal ceramidase N-terminal domain-containing protein [Deltaproteobacteria bacterium]|nr:neutral/alkaline non-lysosomal ceramidase N-terminal domain-containing protein [Deltaproteobacteria bacterium]